MLISSHQHRNLRLIIVSAFITIFVVSGLVWFFVNKNIEINMLGQAVDKNKIVASMLDEEIQKSPKKILNSLSNRQKSNVVNSGDYSSLRRTIDEYLNRFQLQEISLANEKGKINFSTNQTNISKDVVSQEILGKVIQGEAISLSIKNKDEETLYNAALNTIVSIIPVHDINKPQADGNDPVIAIVKVVKNNIVLINEINFIKKMMLIGNVIGGIVFLIVFYYTAKYSDNIVNKYAKQIVTQSKSDPVTGLLNRHHFFRYLRQSVKKTIQENGRSSLLLVDIDHFKELNSKYDHTFGDEVLKIIVQRLSRLLGPDDTVARTGDDEFAILVEHSVSNSNIKDFARKILDKVNEPIQIDAHYLHLTCSIGISIFNQDAKDMEDFIQHADSALYNAKDFGRNNFQIFSRGGGTRQIKFYERQYSLNKALEENEFVLYIQPKVNGDTAAIVGGEALIRWNNPDFGLIQPLEFLPALETSGLIHNVGQWVLEESCRICKSWQTDGSPGIPISVNVSALQFKKESFVSIVSEVLRQTELDPNLLDLELTETCLMDNVEQSLLVLNTLKDMGVRITIDDFGTGYSSLNYLKRFPIDVLKIDRSFVTSICDSSQNDNAAIVTAIMALSHSLHLDVVAEGVETANELIYINALGCKVIQGFLFSEPVPVNEFASLLNNNESLLKILDDVRQELA